ncbi:MAG: DNA circularization N-terminal domain-containing protein [Pseudomonadota bacterium]
MRVWELAFRRASFRGALFWVEEDGPQRGRRVAVMPVSGGDAVITEDMGLAPAEFRVSAYVASDFADFEGLALEAACTSPGPARLVLPMDAGLSAHCISCRRNRTKDRNGYIAYDLTFIPAGIGGALAASGLGAVRDVFAAGVGAAASLIAGAF